MRRLLAVCGLTGLVLGSCAATLAVKGTAPTQLNDGPCTAPVLLPATSTQKVHAQVLGTAKEDSVTANPGTPFSFSWQVPAGTYSVRVWSTIAASPWLVGCDTTASFQAGAPPHKPSLQ